MIDFRTKKTRTILVLSIIYILLLPLILAFMREADSGLFHLLVLGFDKVRVFIRFYTDSTTYIGVDELFAYIYLAPLFFYWIVFPVNRIVGRWVNRGQ